MKPFIVGAKVTWKWLGGTVDGVVEGVFFEPTTKTLKGKSIKRNGSKENPAYLVRSEAGNLALKLHSELTRALTKVKKAQKPKPTFDINQLKEDLED